MKLRKLKEDDAPKMLEWMHDDDVVHHLSANFSEKTIDDCYKFIESAQIFDTDINLAIVDDVDEYMGTVSLKHVDRVAGTAEFAITIRKCAMGKGYSTYGMAEILKRGVQEFGLEKIYWCVSSINERAVRFYDKNGYVHTKDVPSNIKENYSEEQNNSFVWYVYG